MKKLLLFLLAVILAASLGSLLQSLFNLTAISQLAGPISMADWLATILHDLMHFMPVLAAIFFPILLVSLVVSGVLTRWLSLSRIAGSFAIAALGTWIALTLINAFAPMPTLIALNRSVVGTVLLLCCCGIAAIFYRFFTAERRLS
ncbi:hypothetical protein [Alishewanella tabrizica]|uniref:Uncharacterized protein n=1 Tax=Alishewanella tabrizica TaxID=671278 RepID=A0ABQ2WBZ8_9ALTE|nr:hypothetical protein [Alishewanella tabrizica]GGW48950.1 hypothetical protein GCM10008111_00820 [Alishewanella tabrizica]